LCGKSTSSSSSSSSVEWNGNKREEKEGRLTEFVACDRVIDPIQPFEQPRDVECTVSLAAQARLEGAAALLRVRRVHVRRELLILLMLLLLLFLLCCCCSVCACCVVGLIRLRLRLRFWLRFWLWLRLQLLRLCSLRLRFGPRLQSIRILRLGCFPTKTRP
jgi:hypothetical protein